MPLFASSIKISSNHIVRLKPYKKHKSRRYRCENRNDKNVLPVRHSCPGWRCQVQSSATKICLATESAVIIILVKEYPLGSSPPVKKKKRKMHHGPPMQPVGPNSIHAGISKQGIDDSRPNGKCAKIMPISTRKRRPYIFSINAASPKWI